MTQTLAILLPLLRLFAAPAGAGVLASLSFDALRRRLPLPSAPPASLALRLLLQLLYAPMFARYSALALAGVYSVVFSILVAWLVGDPVLLSADTALAAALSAIVGQLAHGWNLSRALPVLDPDEQQVELLKQWLKKQTEATP